MKNNFFYLILIFILASCEDIFEKNIEDITVVLLAPANNLQTEKNTHTFWWEEIKRARNYNLQIVKGTFNSVQELVLDTHLVFEKFDYTLTPGSYQWRVRAYNNGSTTLFSTFSLQIDSTYDLTQQQVVLISPADNYVTNLTQPVFKWDELYNATTYRFEIHTSNWSGAFAASPQLLSSGTYTPSIQLPEGYYEWGVQAINNTSASAFTTRKILIDTTSPGTPILISPSNNSILANAPFTLTWNRITDSGSSLSDSLCIYSDTNLTNTVKCILKSSTNHSDSLGTGNYFWRVRTIDAAGNKSSYSSVWKFSIQ